MAAKKLAWRCIMQSPLTSGSALSWKFVETIEPPAAYIIPSLFHRSTTCWNVSTISGELNGISWVTHWL